MAEFRWVGSPAAGVCNACGSSDNPRGFVDMISESSVTHAYMDAAHQEVREVQGIVDVHYCATCLEQAARLIGSAGAQDTIDLQLALLTAEQECDKLRDEVQAERQRFDQMIEAGAAYREGFNAARKGK